MDSSERFEAMGARADAFYDEIDAALESAVADLAPLGATREQVLAGVLEWARLRAGDIN